MRCERSRFPLAFRRNRDLATEEASGAQGGLPVAWLRTGLIMIHVSSEYVVIPS